MTNIICNIFILSGKTNQDCKDKDGNNPVTLGLENMRGVSTIVITICHLHHHYHHHQPPHHQYHPALCHGHHQVFILVGLGIVGGVGLIVVEILYHKHKVVIIVIIIMITRPKPADGRQGLAGGPRYRSSGHLLGFS